MSEKLSLLDNSSDSEIEITINKNYAKNYNTWRNLEELQKYKDLKKKVDDDESSSESEEEVPEFDEEFFRALSLVKGKDPRIYDKNFELFTNKEIAKKPKIVKQKKTFMKDYERDLVLERCGKFSDEDEEEQVNKKEAPTNEQAENLNSLKNLVKDSDDEDDEPILQERTKTEKEQDAEEADYVKWLKGEEKEVSEELKNDMSCLRNYWNDPKLDEDEKFLRDYILNKRYLEKDGSEIPSYAELTSGMLSDDEKMIEEHEKFEHKYNFRFEEPDEEFIKRYPRTVGDSLRKIDTRRKEKRKEKEERKQKEKEQRQEELKRLKALKRKEIEEKFMKLKEVSGRDEINLDESDIESDFDPDKHDKKMRQMFNDEYYGVEEDQKPEFPYDEDLDNENWNTWTREKCDNEDEEEDEKSDNEDEEEDEKSDKLVEEGCNQDKLQSNFKDEFADEMIKASQRKRKARKKSLFAKVISEAKPLFDPDGKPFEEYLDEYYKLDYEDVIGDMPVRYKYRKVIPNDFGLTVDEILAADDRELNRWCSVKKTCQYRNEDEELYDVQAFQKKAQNPFSKKKILASVYVKNEDDNSVYTESMKEMKNSVFETQGQNESVLCSISDDVEQIKNKDQYSTEINDCNNQAKNKKRKRKKHSSLPVANKSEYTEEIVLEVNNYKSATTVSCEDEQTFKEDHESSAQSHDVKKKKKRKGNQNILGVDIEVKQPTSNNPDNNNSINGKESSELEKNIYHKSVKRKRKDEIVSVVDSEMNSDQDEDKTISKSKSKRVNASDSNENHNENSISEKTGEVLPKKKKKKNKRKKKNTLNNDGNAQLNNSNSYHSKKHKKFVSDDKRLGLSDDRLAAYGINPKKFKN